MADPKNIDYYRHREKRERDMATRASDPHIAGIHHELADRYAAYRSSLPRPKLTMVVPR